jgi:hypothetical protein
MLHPAGPDSAHTNEAKESALYGWVQNVNEAADRGIVLHGDNVAASHGSSYPRPSTQSTVWATDAPHSHAEEF